MNITCPNCAFERTVDESSLPPKAVMATCPKCKHRFRFRESTPLPERESPAPEPKAQSDPLPAGQPLLHQAAQEQNDLDHTARPQPAQPREDDLWNELEALNEDETSEEPSGEERIAFPSALPLWERVQSGYPRAFLQTFLDVLANPRGFFSAMPVGQGYLRPLLFFLLIIQTVALSHAVWLLLGILQPNELFASLSPSAQATLMLVLYPIEVCILLFLDIAINHCFLRLFKADTKGFEGTFRAETYSSAPMLLLVVPYIGLPLAVIGVTVYKFLALRHVHGATSKQVLAVLVLPMLLAMTVAILLILVFGRAQ